MKAYFFAFFFVFFTFFLATFFTFFFATFGMSKDSSYVRPGRATHAAPQNANNMSGLRARLQYTPVRDAKSVLHECHKISIFAALFVLRQFTDDFDANPGFPGPIACKCANHPSSGKSSRFFRIAFTAAGFAFPPVAFIT
jgi:hypothetical protein